MNRTRYGPNFEAPITGQMLIPQQCKDCVFRFKKPYTEDGKTVDNGWKRGDCHIYEVIKPNDVLKNKAECEYYEKEKSTF